MEKDACWVDSRTEKGDKNGMKFVGHCGKVFNEFEVCDEPKIDDLCVGCPYNDEEEKSE